MDGSRGEIARMSWKKSIVCIKRDIVESVIYNEIVDKRKRNQ